MQQSVVDPATLLAIIHTATATVRSARLIDRSDHRLSIFPLTSQVDNTNSARKGRVGCLYTALRRIACLFQNSSSSILVTFTVASLKPRLISPSNNSLISTQYIPLISNKSSKISSSYSPFCACWKLSLTVSCCLRKTQVNSQLLYPHFRPINTWPVCKCKIGCQLTPTIRYGIDCVVIKLTVI